MKPLTNFAVNPTVFSNANSTYYLVEAKLDNNLVDVAEFPFDQGYVSEEQARNLAGQFAYMMNVMGALNQIFPPILDECKVGVPHAERRLEMAIVANLIHHLAKEGFRVHRVNDGGEEAFAVNNMRETLDAVFSVDDSQVAFIKPGFTPHWVRLICGNGQDIITDWSSFKDDRDGFNKAMEAFDAESIKSL